MTTRRRQETWGAIRKLPSGRFQASYVGGDGERWTARTDANTALTFDTKTDARAWLAATRGAIQRGAWESPVARAERLKTEAKKSAANTFAPYAAAWVTQRRSSKGAPLRPKTSTEYARQLAHGLAEFSSDRLISITQARVREWHSRRAQVAPTAAGAEARLLRAILNTALVDGLIVDNPVPGHLTRTSTGRAHRPPTIDELGVILDAIDAKFRLAVLLAAYGSARISEWRALRRRDLLPTEAEIKLADDTTGIVKRYMLNIERQAQHITGQGWVVGAPKSAEGVRVTPLPTWMTAQIDEHLEQYVDPGSESLLFAPVGRSEFLHDRQFTDAWNPAREAAGVRLPTERDDDGKPIAWTNIVREHDLRAFAGTLHAQSGATLRETMAFLGHSTTAAAMSYQYAAEDRLREIADRMPLPPKRAGSTPAPSPPTA